MNTNHLEHKKNTGEFIPYLIIAVFVAFAIFMFYMVFFAFSVDVALVQKDYYAQEIRYQEKIEAIANAAALQDLTINFDDSQQVLKVDFPKEFDASKITGEIWFYCPAFAERDFKVKLQPNNELAQFFNTQKMQKGLWYAKLSFLHQDKNYYKEIEMRIKQ